MNRTTRSSTDPSSRPAPRRRRGALALAAAAALSLATAGCGSAGSGGSDHGGHDAAPAASASVGGTAGPGASAGAHDAADVAFATGMVPHHGQAVTMSDLALERSTNADVRRLATAIRGAQDPEIRTMSAWLTAWGQPVPDPTADHSGHDMGMPMDGMMTAEQMASLEAANGAAFDRLWLELMVAHHEGAVTMSRTELEQGTSPEAKALAQRIIDAQTTEIATMRGLLERTAS